MANRILDGFSFIQSDVMVNHGNGGGPLVDEKGEVVGLTDIGLQPNGAPAGLNFFVPIRDALDVLGLELTPTQAASAAQAGATP
jgi:S1-C subfamily serine protease